MQNQKKPFKSFKEFGVKMIPQVTEIPSLPSMWKGDGVDHINTHWSGKTKIKMLSMADRHRLHHPVLGMFESIEHFWIFIRAARPDDRMRTLPKNQVMRILELTGGIERERRANTKALLAEMFYLKLLSNPHFYKTCKENDLPFDCYDNATGMIPTRDRNSSWLLPAFEEIRKAIRENRLPSFSRLLSLEWMRENDIAPGSYEPWMAYVGVFQKFFGGTPPKFDFTLHSKQLAEKAENIFLTSQRQKEEAAAAKAAEAETTVTAAATVAELEDELMSLDEEMMSEELVQMDAAPTDENLLNEISTLMHAETHAETHDHVLPEQSM